LNIKEFTNTITNIANIAERKQLTDEDIKKIVNDNLERIEKELDKVKKEVKGQLAGVKVFFIDDLESGLLYGNFIVEGGVPKIKTWVNTAKEDLVTDLVDAGKFREVAEEVFSKLVKDGRVVLIGPRGIGKSTLATYVAWRSLLGSLGSVVLDKPMDAVIHIEESLRPGDALMINNLVEDTKGRFVMIYDPSSVMAYYRPETMQKAMYDIKGIRETLKKLMEVRNAWVVIILPSELYEQVQRGREEDVGLRKVLDNLERDVVTVNLGDEGFLREIIKRYSGCDNVSDDLVRRVMGFDSYTLVAKYFGIWIRERGCGVEDVDKALRESAGEPKLFFANYMWSTVLGGNEDLAKKVSVPLILHATFGPIPEGITYITKAVNEGGVWKLIDRNELAESKLEDLREADLEPIAKWLSTKHEDLIEEVLEELVGLRGEKARNNYKDHGFENFINALDWGYNEKVLKEVRELGHEVKPKVVKANFLSIFVSERLKNALKPYANCFKRAALIIGHALAGIPTVPRPEDLSVFLPEDLRRDVAESLGDALRECGVHDYLLVGNKIPPLIKYLTYTRVSTEAFAFIDKYNETVAEVNRILNIAKGRVISDAESFYGLGLASIIANAARLGRDVKASDADTALHIASFTIQRVALPHLIKLVLGALKPLRDKTPHRYLELLAFASNVENLNSDTVRYILYKLNEILDNYGNVVSGYAWSLVNAINAYAVLLRRYISDFNIVEVGDMVGRVVDLLNELDRFKSNLGVIAWVLALAPALRNEDVRGLMEEALRIDVVDKANGILEELSRLRGLVQDLMRDEEFRSYVESRHIKADEEAVRIVILEAASLLKHALAIHRLDNNELCEAEELFNEAARERREIGDYQNYLDYSNWALRAKAIRSKLVGHELVRLVDEFRQLYEEAVNAKRFMTASPYYGTLSLKYIEGMLRDISRYILSGYLVSLALKGGDEEIRRIEELLKEQWLMRTPYMKVSILTRLTLNALLSPRGELSGELKDRLFVKPGEFIVALLGGDIDFNSLPALRAIYGTIKRGDEKRLCDELTGDPILYPIIHDLCMRLVSRVIDYSKELDRRGEGNLRQVLINYFQWWISKGEVLDLLKELGLDAESLNNELRGLIHELSGKSLLSVDSFSFCSKHEQRRCSWAHLTYVLYALINGNEKLAKAHALYGAIYSSSKLLRRLFLEVYKECCDLKSEGFRLALARLFFIHV